MDSQDQAIEQSTQEQPQSTSDQPKEESQFEVNWQKLTWDQLLENYKKLQGEYTKSRQELSNTKKNSELSDEDKRAIDFLKKNDFLTREDLEGYASERKQEAKLWKILAANPDLQAHEMAIKDLSKNTWLAPEDVIEKYGFKSKDKLSKAKLQGDIKWSPAWKPKWVANMSMDEYEKWRAEKGIWNKWTFSN